ncbi:phosphoenolpyruvate carboxylase [Nanoarchaeota archaeon]
MKISRLMSTQHPDNVSSPFFAQNHIISGDDEVKEAFYTYSHLDIDEQLWDAEGKEVDNFVIEKLLTRYSSFFQKNILGQNKFLTLRVPNPDVEKTQGKILLESLNSIPRNFDLAKLFYQKEIAPIFEVVVPMCSSEKNLIRISQYYQKHIFGQQNCLTINGDISLSQWLGEFGPPSIKVTPLFETKDAIVNSADYVEKYIQSEKIKEMQRVWFARSDPALNYGSVAAVLLNKVGLIKLHELQEKISIDIMPIIGCGSSPFRGNFKPTNIKNMVRGYPSIQTFTAQSAFKYDFPLKKVLAGVEEINNIQRKEPYPVDIDQSLILIDKMEKDYGEAVRTLAPIINLVSKDIPPRRKRKLHVGLFGYARENQGVALPRAIKFCASLYSLGLPPEIFGLSALNEKEIDQIRNCYPNLDQDMADAFQYFNKDNLSFFPQEIQRKVLPVLEKFNYEVNQEHQQATGKILSAIKKQDVLSVQENMLKAGHIRQFLG